MLLFFAECSKHWRNKESMSNKWDDQEIVQHFRMTKMAGVTLFNVFMDKCEINAWDDSRGVWLENVNVYVLY